GEQALVLVEGGGEGGKEAVKVHRLSKTKAPLKQGLKVRKPKRTSILCGRHRVNKANILLH
ncbi:hypothetical protein LQR31_17355, partial [Chromobacterium vaccinii]|uniref:hypothetical protein n=1 Tax=Chromobacterium vaccinii TaxID=1108595 RepID=UPI001E43B365